MKSKQSILKKIVPFLTLVMVLIFASSASVAEARSQNPHRDGDHDRPAAHDRNHNHENTDRDDSSHSDDGDDTNHDGDHDNHDDMDDDETSTHEPTAEIFSAALSPENETTPPVLDNADNNEDSDEGETTADELPEGVAEFRLVTRQVYDEETDSRVEVQELYYRLYVRNIEEVTGAHIHIGQPGEDGDIVAPLFSGDPAGEFNGLLAEGVISMSDLTGPLAGDMDGLVQMLENGGLYVNVHTVMNPAGEIRGQINAH